MSSDDQQLRHRRGGDTLTSRRATGLLASAGAVAASLVLAGAACSPQRGLVLTDLAEARGLAADLRVQFVKAANAANQAVMADTDEASLAAAEEARSARQAVEQGAQALRPMLQGLGYQAEIRLLGDFDQRFAEYRTEDDTILELAIENTNLKAQRLAFGPAREASEAFRAALDRVASAAVPKNRDRAQAVAARAQAAILEVQILESRHIAEPDEAAMSAMEAQMTRSEAAARSGLEALKTFRPAGASELSEAEKALDQFTVANAEIIRLSRRNTNVRSLALAMGRKRTVTAECEDALQALADALAKHQFTATR